MIVTESYGTSESDEKLRRLADPRTPYSDARQDSVNSQVGFVRDTSEDTAEARTREETPWLTIGRE
jgi:hypothetical protein